MIHGIGIDAVELSRMEKIIKEKSKLITRILTPAEFKLFEQLPFKRQIEFLGGRFACKEAFSKAWGTGIGAVTFQDVEVLVNEKGAPIVTKSPFQTGVVFVSITHTQELALAQIILEERKG